MKILAVLQARMSSKRLPGKVLKPILGEPMLLRQIERVRKAQTLCQVVVATSNTSDDDAIADACRRAGVSVFRGALDDVLGRFVAATKGFEPTHVVRLTGDCPLADPGVIDRVVSRHLSSGADYTSNVRPPTYPDGLDVEVMKAEVLSAADREAASAVEREHVTLFISRHPDRFKIVNVENDNGDMSNLRWTVDEPADLELVEAIYEGLYPSNPAFTMADVLAWLDLNSAWREHNLDFKRNEGLARALAKETNSK